MERAKKRRIEIFQSRDKEQNAHSKWAKKQKKNPAWLWHQHHGRGKPWSQRPFGQKRNTSAVSSHTMSSDREEISPTRVTSPSQGEDSSESNREEISPTRGMSPLQSEASSDLECIETSDVYGILRVRIPQTLKWTSSVSLKAESVCTCVSTSAGHVSHQWDCPCNHTYVMWCVEMDIFVSDFVHRVDWHRG